MRVADHEQPASLTVEVAGRIRRNARTHSRPAEQASLFAREPGPAERWRESAASAVEAAMAAEEVRYPLQGPVRLEFVARFGTDDEGKWGHWRQDREGQAGLDNQAKLLIDACVNACAVLEHDQIVEIHAAQMWCAPEDEGVSFQLMEVGASPANVPSWMASDFRVANAPMRALYLRFLGARKGAPVVIFVLCLMALAVMRFPTHHPIGEFAESFVAMMLFFGTMAVCACASIFVGFRTAEKTTKWGLWWLAAGGTFFVLAFALTWIIYRIPGVGFRLLPPPG